MDFYTAFAPVFTDAWREHAVCIGTPDDLFFDPAQEAEAKRFCDVCPVRRQCLDDALYYEDEYCFKGGLSDAQRQSIIRHRKRHAKAFQYDLGLISG